MEKARKEHEKSNISPAIFTEYQLWEDHWIRYGVGNALKYVATAVKFLGKKPHLSSFPAVPRNWISGSRWLNTASRKDTRTLIWCLSVPGGFPIGVPWKRLWSRWGESITFVNAVIGFFFAGISVFHPALALDCKNQIVWTFLLSLLRLWVKILPTATYYKGTKICTCRQNSQRRVNLQPQSKFPWPLNLRNGRHLELSTQKKEIAFSFSY